MVPGTGRLLKRSIRAGSCRELSLSEAVRYDTALVRRGIAYVDRGIEAYPSRLDMRFGKIYALGEIGDYGRYVDAVAVSADNACRWLWSDDRPLEDGREFMLSAVQDYVNRLYELGTDEGLDGMDRIASTVLGIYPDHVESLDNAAIVRIVRGRYDEAKPLLMRAERLAPRDMTILANLAELHVRQGDRPAAATYYRRMADCAEGSDGITLCGGSASWRRKSDISRIRIRSLRGRFCAECLSESWKIGGNRSMGERIFIRTER